MKKLISQLSKLEKEMKIIKRFLMKKKIILI
jgi:hypothetical protein